MKPYTKNLMESELWIMSLWGVTVLCLIVWDRSRRVGPGREGLGTNFEFDLEQYQDNDSSYDDEENN